MYSMSDVVGEIIRAPEKKIRHVREDVFLAHVEDLINYILTTLYADESTLHSPITYGSTESSVTPHQASLFFIRHPLFELIGNFRDILLSLDGGIPRSLVSYYAKPIQVAYKNHQMFQFSFESEPPSIEDLITLLRIAIRDHSHLRRTIFMISDTVDTVRGIINERNGIRTSFSDLSEPTFEEFKRCSTQVMNVLAGISQLVRIPFGLLKLRFAEAQGDPNKMIEIQKDLEIHFYHFYIYLFRFTSLNLV